MANLIEVIIRGNAASAIKALGVVEQKSKQLAIAGAAIVGPLALVIKNTVTYGEELDRASKITGVSVEKLAALRFAVEQEHGSFEGLIAATRRWSKVMIEASDPTSKQAKLLTELGMSVKNLQAVGLDEQLLQIGKALRGVENEMDRVAIAQELLGKGARELLPFLIQTGDAIRYDMEMAKKLGLVLDAETVKGLEKFGDRAAELRGALRGVSYAIGVSLMPVVQSLIIQVANAVMGLTAWIKKHPELTTNVLKLVGAIGLMLTVLGGVGFVAASAVKALKTLNVLILAATNPWLILAAAIGLAIFKFAEWDETVRRGEAAKAKLVEKMAPGMPSGIIKTKTGVRRMTAEEQGEQVVKQNIEAIRKVMAEGDAGAKKLATAYELAAEKAELFKDKQMALASIEEDARTRLGMEVVALEDLREALAVAAAATSDLAEKRAAAAAIARIEIDLLIRGIQISRMRTRTQSEIAKDEFIKQEKGLTQREIDLSVRKVESDKEEVEVLKAKELATEANAQAVQRLEEAERRAIDAGVKFIDAQGDRIVKAMSDASQAIRDRTTAFQRAQELEPTPQSEADRETATRRRTMAEREFIRTIIEELAPAEGRLMQLKKELDEATARRDELLRKAMGGEDVGDALAVEEKTIANLERVLGLTKEQVEQLRALRHQWSLLGKQVEEVASAASMRAVDGIRSAISTALMDIITFSKSGWEILRDFGQSVGKSILNEIVKMATEAMIRMLGIREMMEKMFPVGGGINLKGGGGIGGIIGLIASLFFGHGGISPGHLVPIARAANGMVTSRPTLAAISEFGQEEAVIPMKGGRVPVEMTGGGKQNTFVIYAWDTATGMDQLYKHRQFIMDMTGAGRRENHPSFRGA